MQKKANSTALIVIAVLVVIGLIAAGLIYFLILPKPQPSSVIPPQCQIEKTGTDFNSYECPSDVDSCEISVSLTCNEKNEDERVIFRGSSQTALPTTISVDSNGDGALEPFSRGSGFSSPCVSNAIITYLPEPYQSNYVYYRSGVKICVADENRGYNYVSGGSISTSATPLEGEECSGTSGFIRCAGNIANYECTKNILDGSGKIIKAVTYSGPSAGTKKETITLNPGQEAYWSGQIDWKEVELRESQCIRNKADTLLPNAYYICSEDQFGCGVLSSKKSYCSPANYVYNEESQKCVPPYTVNVNLEKPVISTSEKFIIDFELKDTENNANIPVTAEIKRGTTVISTKTQLTGNTYLTLGKTQFTLDAPAVGYYELTISFSSNEGDFSKEYAVQVTENLNVIVTADNPIQFDSSPIVVYLKSFKSGSAKQLSDFEVDAVYNGVNQYIYLVEDTNVGVKKITFSGLKGDGTLRVRARGQDDSGLWTEWTEYFDVVVKKATILFTTDFPSDECIGSQTLKFETKDSIGNLAETQNQIQIDKPLGGNDYPTVSGSGGKYSFTYNFAEGGLYTVRITSTSPTLGTAQLGTGQGEKVNVLTGDVCGGGGGGGIDWTIYLIGGGFVFAIIVFIYFVFIRK